MACSIQDRQKKTRQVKIKIKTMIIIFFYFKRVVHKEFVRAGNPVYFAYYYQDLRRKYEKISLRNLATKELALPSRQRTVSHFLFHHGILTSNNTTVVPHLLYFSLLPRLKIKLKGRHFDTIEAIEAESQATLKILAKHDFQETFKNGSGLGTVRTRGMGLLRG
jgi:hypothetical protein